MHSQRPVYLNLLKIRQPLPAVVSIFHRLSGALLFLAIPVVLYLFEGSLASKQSFVALTENTWARVGLFIALALYAYHFLAGVRFLLFDLHRPGLYRHMKWSASAVLAAAGLAIILLGVWLR